MTPKQAPQFSAFISHAKADAKKAQEIAASLEERGLKCWIAPRDVKAGRAYGDEIIRGIESAKAFVLVLSKASNESAFVAREVERAVSKQKPIFAIRLASVEPAPSLELFISGTQWIDAFSGKLGPHIDRLAKLLAEEEGAEPAIAESQKPRTMPRWAWPAGAVSAVLLAGAVGIIGWHWSGKLEPPSLSTDQQTTPAPPPATVDNSDPDFQACDHGAGDAAIAACNRAIGSGKFSGRNLAFLYNDRGYLQMANGKLDEGLTDLNESIRIDPYDPYPYWNRGEIYRYKGDAVSAKADYERALALGPQEQHKPQIEAALRSLDASTTATANSASLSDQAGRALGLNPQASDVDFQACEKASGDQGIAACDRAIASGKFSGRNLSYLHNDRGFLRMQGGDLDQALVDLDEAIRIDASNFFAYWNRGAVYGAKSDFVRAQDDFTKALALNPDDTTKAKIIEALNAVTASAKAADSQSYDPSVISDPSYFGGEQQGSSASAAESYPADAAPPPYADMAPALPAAPSMTVEPVPAR